MAEKGATVKIKVRQKNSEGELQEMTCEMNEELAIFLNSPIGDPETKESIVKMIFDTQAPQVEQGPETPDSVLHTAETEDSDQKVHIWSETEEKQLIALRTEMDDAFYKNKNHETLWQKIFENMNSAGIKVTKQQIMNKWRNLKRKYKETIDLNKKTGNEKHEFKYQNEFDNLFGHKASTKAAVSFDSGVNAEERKKKREIDKKATRPKKRSAENLLMKMENMNKEMREQMERHQEEKLRRFDRLLDIIEKQGQK
uniref:Myb-like domain-containing protein n=1 Tax=Magallana gigas TaxID=29159 RepID=A0A8W8I085_MAGGI